MAVVLRSEELARPCRCSVQVADGRSRIPRADRRGPAVDPQENRATEGAAPRQGSTRGNHRARQEETQVKAAARWRRGDGYSTVPGCGFTRTRWRGVACKGSDTCACALTIIALQKMADSVASMT